MPNNLEPIQKIGEFRFNRGYISSAPKDIPTDYMAQGSENVMMTGTGKTQVFKGMTIRSGQAGGKVMSNIAENYVSLGSVTAPETSATPAFGNVFNVFSALFYIGAGLVRLVGVSLLVVASSTLSLLIKRNGSYTANPALSGPWQAGLAPPSAPVIRAVAPPAGFEGKVSGVVSVVIWRIRSSTGAVSNQSPVSNIVAATNQAIAVTFPLKDYNGQDYWGIGVTKQAEGRVGSHFQLLEFPETDLISNLTRTDVATTIAVNDITSAGATFSSTHIGWQAVFTGGSPACVFTSYVTAVPSATTLTLNDAAPVTSTGVNMVLTSASGGTIRTKVIEWRDGDLYGREFAPTRSFSAPAALFGGTLEDVSFVDGAYADAVSAVSPTVRGSGIAPSERGRPESFSPDTVIFTNDTPTALIRGDGIYWRFGRNSLSVIRYLGGDKPLSIEPVWNNIGIDNAHNAALGEGGRLYAWTSGRGLVRMDTSGLPESEFANVVADDLMYLTDSAKRVLGWDGLSQVMCCCYNKAIYPYFAALGVWGAPLNLTGLIAGNIKACVTEHNQLLVSDDLDNLYDFNIGTGSIAKIRSGWQTANASMETVHSVLASVRADNTTYPVTIEVLADGNPSVIESTQSVSPPRTGYQTLLPVRPNVIDAEMHCVQITIRSNTPTGDCGVSMVQTYGDGNSIQR